MVMQVVAILGRLVNKGIDMNKTLTNRVIKALLESSKTLEVIRDNQSKAGLKSANVTAVKKVQLDSLIKDVQATIKDEPVKQKRPVTKKKQTSKKPKEA